MKKLFVFSALLVIATSYSAYSDSLVRVQCDDEDAGTEVYFNDKFVGECPVDAPASEGTVQLRSRKIINADYEKVFEKKLRVVDGVPQRVEIVLSKAQLTPDGKVRTEAIEKQKQKEKAILELEREKEREQLKFVNVPSTDLHGGSVRWKLVWSEGKRIVNTATPSGEISSIQTTVIGTDVNGKAIPVLRGAMDIGTNQGTINSINPGRVTVSVKALAGNKVRYEGLAIGVEITSGATAVGTILMSPPLVKAQDLVCIQCHETTLDTEGQSLVANFKYSGHYKNQNWASSAKYGVTGTGCAGCHGPQHDDHNPSASGRCYECHGAFLETSHRGNDGQILKNNCVTCHQSHNFMGHKATEKAASANSKRLQGE